MTLLPAKEIEEPNERALKNASDKKQPRERSGNISQVNFVMGRPTARQSCCLPICWANRCCSPHNPHRQTIICEEDKSAIASPRKRCMSAHKALALYLIAPCISSNFDRKTAPIYVLEERKKVQQMNGWLQLRQPRGQKKVQCDLRATIKCNKSK